jgi:hypothetical protein
MLASILPLGVRHQAHPRYRPTASRGGGVPAFRAHVIGNKSTPPQFTGKLLFEGVEIVAKSHVPIQEARIRDEMQGAAGPLGALNGIQGSIFDRCSFPIHFGPSRCLFRRAPGNQGRAFDSTKPQK